MPQTLPNGITAPINADAYNLTSDLATMGNSTNAVIVVANQTARDALTPTAGMLVWRADTNQVEVYASGAWYPITPAAGGTPFAMSAGSTAFNMANTNYATVSVAFPTGRFTSAPIVTLGKSMSGYGGVVFFAVNSTPAGFTLGAQNASGASITQSVGCTWTATQMTSASGIG